MRPSYKTAGKSRDKLIEMVHELSGKLYRLERQKTVLRRSLALLKTLGDNAIVAFNSGNPTLAREICNRIVDNAANALFRTDARSKRRS